MPDGLGTVGVVAHALRVLRVRVLRNVALEGGAEAVEEELRADALTLPPDQLKWDCGQTKARCSPAKVLQSASRNPYIVVALGGGVERLQTVGQHLSLRAVAGRVLVHSGVVRGDARLLALVVGGIRPQVPHLVPVGGEL